jgi:uncharacterized lipoprotein NlpE involved in copper resistance
MQIKKNKKKIYLCLLLLLLLTFVLMGCNNNLDDYKINFDNSNSDNDFKIIDKSFVMDDEGYASFIQVVVETKLGCEIQYDKFSVSSSNDVNEGRIVFMEQVNDRLNLNLWTVCCNDFCKFEVEK